MIDYPPGAGMLIATILITLLCCLALVLYAKRLGIIPARLSETAGAPTETRKYRFFGLPIWSVSRSIDENDLYRRMENRFEERMSQALQKVMEEKR